MAYFLRHSSRQIRQVLFSHIVSLSCRCFCSSACAHLRAKEGLLEDEVRPAGSPVTDSESPRVVSVAVGQVLSFLAATRRN